MAGVTAVPMESGESRRIAKIFATHETIGALSAGSTQPGNADTLADSESAREGAKRHDVADDFMPWDDWQHGMQVAVGDVKVGSADAASIDLD